MMINTIIFAYDFTSAIFISDFKRQCLRVDSTIYFQTLFIDKPFTRYPLHIFAQRTISQCTMPIRFVVMVEDIRKVLYNQYPLRFRHDVYAVTLYRFHKTLCHSVAFRAAYRRMFRLQSDHARTLSASHSTWEDGRLLPKRRSTEPSMTPCTVSL